MAPHPQYWKIKAHAHARGEAHARAQQAAQLAQAAGAQARNTTAALDKLMRAAGFDSNVEYRFDDETETIALAKEPTKIADEPLSPPPATVPATNPTDPAPPSPTLAEQSTTPTSPMPGSQDQ